MTEWVYSPGFAGVAAVLAAVIAYLAAGRSSRSQARAADADRAQRERADRKEQWWQRARWALDLTLSESVGTRTVGFQVLDALAESEWAGEHEADVIAAATTRVLARGPEPDDAGPLLD